MRQYYFGECEVIHVKKKYLKKIFQYKRSKPNVYQDSYELLKEDFQGWGITKLMPMYIIMQNFGFVLALILLNKFDVNTITYKLKFKIDYISLVKLININI